MEGKQEKIPLILKTNDTSLGEMREQVSCANKEANWGEVSNRSCDHVTRAQVNTNEDRQGDGTSFEPLE